MPPPDLTAADRAHHARRLAQQLGDDNRADRIRDADRRSCRAGRDCSAKATRRSGRRAARAGAGCQHRHAQSARRTTSKNVAQADGPDRRTRSPPRRMNERIDRMQKDFDYKLCSLSAQQLGATAGGAAERAFPAAAAPASACSRHAAACAAGRCTAADRRRRIWRRRRASSAHCRRNDAAARAAAVDGRAGNASWRRIDTRPQFEAAMNLLAKAQYDEAAPRSAAFADSLSEGRSGAAGGLLGRRHRLCAEGLSDRRARLRRRDQEISDQPARAGKHAEARPVAASR